MREVTVKKKISLLLLLLAFAGLNAETPYFYYNGEEKRYLELNTRYIFVSVASENAAERVFTNAKYDPLRADISKGKRSQTNRNIRFDYKLSDAEPRHCEKLRSNFVAIQRGYRIRCGMTGIDCRATLAMTDYKKNVILQNYKFFIVLIFENIFNYIKRFYNAKDSEKDCPNGCGR